MVIDGKKIAQNIIEELRKLPRSQKKLAAVFVGENPASESFLKQKNKAAGELDMQFLLIKLPETVSEKELIFQIRSLGDDPKVGGIIVQLPLPPKYNLETIIKSINPEKDVDALVSKKVLPLPVMVVEDVLKGVNFDLKERVVGVVGRGLLVGKPIADWLKGKCKEVMVFHSKTGLEDLKKADLVITGVGKAGLIKPAMLKSGAGVIDFGFDMVDGKIRGDFDSEPLVNGQWSLSFYTPTPGGTGPILVAELFRNFYKLNHAG